MRHHKSFFHRLISFFSFMISRFDRAGVRMLICLAPRPIFQVPRPGYWHAQRCEFCLKCATCGRSRHRRRCAEEPLLIRMSEWWSDPLSPRDRVMVNSPGFIAHVETVSGARRVELIQRAIHPCLTRPALADFRRAHHLEDKFVAVAGAHGMSNIGCGIRRQSCWQMKRKSRSFARRWQREAPCKRAEQMQLSNVSFIPSVPKSKCPRRSPRRKRVSRFSSRLSLQDTIDKVFDYMAAGRPIVLPLTV